MRPSATGQIGTATTQPIIDFGGMTYSELQSFKEIEAGIPINLVGKPPEIQLLRVSEKVASEQEGKVIKKYQNLIDIGKLDLSTAEQKAGEEFQKNYETEFGKQSESLLGKIERTRIEGLGKTRGDILAGAGTTITTAAPLTAAFLSGSPVAVGVASAFITGKGSTDIQKAILGESLPVKQRVGLAVGGVAQAGIGLYGLNLAIAPTPTSLLARESQKEFLKELELQPSTIYGKELVRGDKGSLFKFSASKVVGGGRAAQEIEMIAPAFRTGAKTYSITGGRAISTTRIVDVISNVPLTSKEVFSFGGRITTSGNILKLGFGGVNVGVPEIQTSAGSGFLMRKGSETFKEFKIAGAVKREGDILKVIGIEPKKAILTRQQSALGERFVLGGKNELMITEKLGVSGLKGRLGSAGQIQLLPSQKDFVKFISPASIKKTPLSATFGEQIQTQVIGGGVLPSFSRQALKEATGGMIKQVSKTSSKQISLGIASGLKLETTTQQIEKLFSPTLTTSLQNSLSRQALVPIIKTDTLPRLSTRQRQRSLSSVKLRQQLTQQMQEPLSQFAPPITQKPSFDMGRSFLPFILPAIPPFNFNVKKGVVTKGRGFMEVTTFYGAMAFEFGFKQPKARTKRQQMLGAPLEIPMMKVKLPTVLIGKA